MRVKIIKNNVFSVLDYNFKVGDIYEMMMSSQPQGILLHPFEPKDLTAATKVIFVEDMKNYLRNGSIRIIS